MKLNRKAFSTIEALLVVLILVIIGASGAYVYTANKNVNKNLKAASQDASGSPKFSSKKKTSASSTQSSQATNHAAESKAPADSQTPAAGSCDAQSGSVVSVALNPDIPSPRCVKVTADQKLSLTNNHTEAITVTLGFKTLTIEAGQTGTIDDAFGNYLQPGVHDVKTTASSGGGPEIWLQ